MSGEWEILGNYTETVASPRELGELLMFSRRATLRFSLKLKRRPGFEANLLIFPCPILGWLSVFVFTLPTNSSDRLTLGKLHFSSTVFVLGHCHSCTNLVLCWVHWIFHSSNQSFGKLYTDAVGAGECGSTSCCSLCHKVGFHLCLQHLPGYALCLSDSVSNIARLGNKGFKVPNIVDKVNIFLWQFPFPLFSHNSTSHFDTSELFCILCQKCKFCDCFPSFQFVLNYLATLLRAKRTHDKSKQIEQGDVEMKLAEEAKATGEVDQQEEQKKWRAVGDVMDRFFLVLYVICCFVALFFIPK